MTARGFAHGLRLSLVALGVVVCFGAVAQRLVELHVLDRGHHLARIQETRRRVVEEPARRGDILDARGDILATSQTDITLAVDPWALPEKIDSLRQPGRQRRFEIEQAEARSRLADLLGLPLSEIEAAFALAWREVDPARDTADELVDGRVRARFVKLREHVTEEQFARILPLRVAGLTYERRYRRVYPQRSLAAHVIGFVNKEDVPSGGVEAFADTYLKGLAGWREIERDGRRVERAEFREREVPASDGWSVVLSIDAAVQHIVEQELDALVEKFRPQKATVLVSDAHTGFLLALANYPTFDLNEFSTTPLERQRNIAAADLVEPGSTFKIVATAGALNEGLVNPATRFDCSIDSIVHNGRPRRFMRDDHPYVQPLTVADIIAKSSNVGTAQLGMLLGERALYDYARAFGFGERSGYPLGREEPGLLADPKDWSGIDITRIPAGYSIAATPLQIHYAMGVIASGGELFRPQIIRQLLPPLLTSDEERRFSFAPASRRRVLAAPTAESMARMLQRVVSADGTAKIAVIPGYEVAGKTGTAQKLIDGRYSSRNHVGSFVGFFPASRPRVVITVIVDDGKPPSGGTAYGSVVAAPSFKRIAERLIQYLDIKPVAPLTPAGIVAQGSSTGRP
jgi:cell division protein FtsI/penicillin-binding protein 2